MILANKSQFSVDYRDQKLNNVFVLNDSEKTNYIYDGDSLFYGPVNWNELFEVESCLFIATPILDNNEVVTSLQNLAAKGIVIFILLGKPELSKHAIDSLAGHCCIRAGVPQNGSLAIADHGCSNSFSVISSTLFGSGEPEQYLCRLNENQEEDYFGLFCRLFWHEAKYEYLSQSNPLNRLVEKESSPVQEIDVAHKHIFPESLTSYLQTSALHARHIYSHSDADKLCGILEQNEVVLEKDTEIWLNLNQVSSKNLIHLVKKSKKIFLTESPLIQMINTDNEAWVLPKDSSVEDYNWTLKLTNGQLGDVIEFNEIISSTKNWSLKSKLSVANINSPIRYLDSIEKKNHWQENVKKDLGKIECRDFEEYENTFKSGGVEAFCHERQLLDFKKNNLAKEISFSIDIQPPRLPNKATRDKLNDEWVALQKSWDDQVEELKGKLNKIENSKSNITENIRLIMGTFLTGQLTSKRTLDKELNELADISLCKLSSSYRIEKIEVINNITQKIIDRGIKLTKEQDKANQEIQWKKTKASLESEVSKAKTKKENAENKLTEVMNESNKSLEKQNLLLLEVWKNGLSKSLSMDKQRFLEFTSEEILEWLGQNIDNSSKNKNKNKKSKEESSNPIPSEELKSIQIARKEFDLKVKHYDEECESHKKTLKNAEQHLQRVTGDLNKLGNFVAKDKDTNSELSKLLGNNKLVSNKIDFVLPKEDLPEVGSLFSHKQERYLLIQHETEVEQGKLDCERLNAKLVILEE